MRTVAATATFNRRVPSAPGAFPIALYYTF